MTKEIEGYFSILEDLRGQVKKGLEGGDKTASDYDVPTVRVLTADTWKTMDVEIEWGFDSATGREGLQRTFRDV